MKLFFASRSKQIALGNDRNVNNRSDFHRFVEEFSWSAQLNVVCWQNGYLHAFIRQVWRLSMAGNNFHENLFDFIWRALWFTLWIDWKRKFIFSTFKRCEKYQKIYYPLSEWRKPGSLRDTSQLEPRACKWTWVVTIFRNDSIISRANADELTLIIREIYCWKFHSVNHSKD